MIRVFSLFELVAFLKESERQYDACISLWNPGSIEEPLITRKVKNVMRLAFYDISKPDPENGKIEVATIAMVKEMVDFYKQHAYADPFLIHCSAGIGRSPAVALGLLFIQLHSEAAAKIELQRMRPKAFPNKRVVALFDDLLGSNLRKVAKEIWDERIVYMKTVMGFDPQFPDDNI
jgi:predicted protein tyrosine phosphatase